jgi:hypothetical protein
VNAADAGTDEAGTRDGALVGELARLREPVPKTRDVAATARAAIDAMRRGVIAYTALAD